MSEDRSRPPDPGGHPTYPQEPGQVEGQTVTGHPAVDTALRTLAGVAQAHPADQLPAFQAAHRTLRETLTSIDEEG